MNYLTLLLSFCIFSIHSVASYYLNLDANSEDCFFDRVASGTKMVLLFEVVEGGFLDIDVKLSGPDSKVIYSGSRESNGKYAFSAHVDGIYKYCFGNKMSSMTPKIIAFSLEVVKKNKEKEIGSDSKNQNNKLEDMVYDLSSDLVNVKHELEYLKIRDKIHRNINDNTNSRVVLWSAFETLLLISMTIGQILYLRRFFEVRRMV